MTKQQWHQRLGHPSTKALDSIIKFCKLPTMMNEENRFCDACQFGKSHTLPFPSFVSHAQTKFELVHTDIWGPAPYVHHSEWF